MTFRYTRTGKKTLNLGAFPSRIDRKLCTRFLHFPQTSTITRNSSFSSSTSNSTNTPVLELIHRKLFYRRLFSTKGKICPHLEVAVDDLRVVQEANGGAVHHRHVALAPKLQHFWHLIISPEDHRVSPHLFSLSHSKCHKCETALSGLFLGSERRVLKSLCHYGTLLLPLLCGIICYFFRSLLLCGSQLFDIFSGGGGWKGRELRGCNIAGVREDREYVYQLEFHDH